MKKKAVINIHGKGGSAGNMQSLDTIKAFVETAGADLTVMENGGHRFHTEEQMAFLDSWISSYIWVTCKSNFTV